METERSQLQAIFDEIAELERRARGSYEALELMGHPAAPTYEQLVAGIPAKILAAEKMRITKEVAVDEHKKTTQKARLDKLQDIERQQSLTIEDAPRSDAGALVAAKPGHAEPRAAVGKQRSKSQRAAAAPADGDASADERSAIEAKPRIKREHVPVAAAVGAAGADGIPSSAGPESVDGRRGGSKRRRPRVEARVDMSTTEEPPSIHPAPAAVAGGTSVLTFLSRLLGSSE